MSRSKLREARAAGARDAEEVFNLFSAASRRLQADGQPSLVDAGGSEATPKSGR